MPRTVFVGFGGRSGITKGDIEEFVKSKGFSSRFTVVLPREPTFSDREPSTFKGFCFIRLGRNEDVDSLISALNGEVLKGRKLGTGVKRNVKCVFRKWRRVGQ